MTISASVKNSLDKNEVTVSTNAQSKTVAIPSKESGYGSSVNGGELLLLALATCYCNDIYREAAKRNIQVTEVEVQVTASFGAEGEPGGNFQYKPIVKSNASAEELRQLIEHTDSVAEIHNTLRKGTNVKLVYQ
jgi:uncharacterized OsmC-like protein